VRIYTILALATARGLQEELLSKLHHALVPQVPCNREHTAHRLQQLRRLVCLRRLAERPSQLTAEQPIATERSQSEAHDRDTRARAHTRTHHASHRAAQPRADPASLLLLLLLGGEGCEWPSVLPYDGSGGQTRATSASASAFGSPPDGAEC
jgi:hypothetical protein